MDAIDRIKVLESLESLTRSELAEMTGLKKTKWDNYLLRKQRLYQEDLEKLADQFPEYKSWLLTGDEYPEAGQISPMTKKAQQTLKPTPGAG